MKWPNVPACYGWLSLDRRGNWRLKGEVVHHIGLISFISQHYGDDGKGNWIFQNGPQAVYVALDYTPLIFRFDSDGRLLDHTGREAGTPIMVWIDEEGSVLLHTRAGIGLLDDRYLGGFLDACSTRDGRPLDDCSNSGLPSEDIPIFWRGLSVQSIRGHEVPARFGFNPSPKG